MSSERKLDAFGLAIIIISAVGIILLLAIPFAGFYLPAWGSRYSCISCSYYTDIDLTAQIIALILLIMQLVLGVNELVPNRFINFDKLDFIGMILASATILFAMIGLGAFGIFYSNFEWWPETAWYGSFFAGVLNTILYILRFKKII